MGVAIALALVFLFALSSSVGAQNKIRLDSDQTRPFHYSVELKINVDTKRFYVEESIDLSIAEDTEELQINVNKLDGSWLKTRLVNQATQEEHVPLLGYTMADDVSEILYLMFDQVIPGSANYTLHFTGIVGEFGVGFREFALDSNTKLISTGFDTTNLRAIFPCFDQPEFKTTYSFTIYYTRGYTLITNAAEMTTDGPIYEDNNYMRSTFQIEDPLSTSSIAIALTNMDALVEDRVTVYHPNSATGKILSQTYGELFKAVEQELNVFMSLAHLKIIYAPALPYPTLSKWGIIFLGAEMAQIESNVLYSVELRSIQKEIARSVYQLFLGEMITPEWWDSQWVTRGLATYLSAVSKHLPFDGEKEFLIDSVHRVIREDHNTNTWLKQNITYGKHINDPNLLVVQHKAGATMRMIANIMGDGKFLEAVLDYIASNQFRAIDSSKFGVHLDLFCPEDALPSGTKLSSVITQYETEGYQTMASTIKVDHENSIYLLTRNIDYSTNYPVSLPVDYTSPTYQPEYISGLWLVNSGSPNLLMIRDSYDLIIVNPRQIGMYRVNYQTSMWEEIVRRLAIDHQLITNRGQLIEDSVNLAMDREISVGQHFNVIRYLTNETDTWTWRVARRSFEALTFFLRGIKETERLEKFYSDLVEEQYLENRFALDMVDFEKTMQVGWIACASGYPECVQDLEKYVNSSSVAEQGLKGSEDFQYLVYCTLTRYSTNHDSLFNSMIFGLLGDGTFESFAVAIRGLGCSADKAAIKSFLDLAGTNQLALLGIQMTPAQRLLIFHSSLHGSYEGTLYALEYILENYIQINDLLVTMDKLFFGVGEFIRTLEQEQMLQRILDVHTLRITGTVRGIILIELLNGRTNRLMLGLVEAQVNSWLQDNVHMPGLGNTLRAVNCLSLMVVITMIKYLLT